MNRHESLKSRHVNQAESDNRSVKGEGTRYATTARSARTILKPARMSGSNRTGQVRAGPAQLMAYGALMSTTAETSLKDLLRSCNGDWGSPKQTLTPPS